MFVTMVFISFVLLSDGVLLLVDPALYRRCVEFVEEIVGPSWPVINGTLFLLAGLVILISGIFNAMPVLFAGIGCAIGLVGVFFLLAATQTYRYLSVWWAARPNVQHRVAGAIFISFGVSLMRYALEIR